LTYVVQAFRPAAPRAGRAEECMKKRHVFTAENAKIAESSWCFASAISALSAVKDFFSGSEALHYVSGAASIGSALPD
jgi:hypothetical protein